MAKFWAVLLAFALNCNVIYIFTKAEDYDCFQYPTYIMFLIGMFALLWDTCVYPENFRRLYACCEFLIEFIMVTFLMEFILIEFLMPLEKAVVEFVPSIAEGIEYLMKTAGLEIGPVDTICELLKTDDAKLAASYALGAGFLISIFHATRLIDLRILQCDGAGAFISDATCRTQKFYQELFGSSCRRNRCRQNCCATSSHPFHDDENDDDADAVDDRYINRHRCR